MSLATSRAMPLLVFLSLSLSIMGQATHAPSFVQREFNFSTGKFQLEGRLLLPDTLSRHPVILNVWGSGPTRMQHYIRNSKILKKFTDTGYAVVLYDKPGSGDSRGKLPEKQLLYNRAKIARAALEKLKTTPFVDPDRVGLYGSSQAAYVMAFLLEDPRDISFAVCWSCPMENSIEQTAYQIREYLLCAGRDIPLAEKAAQSYKDSKLAGDYSTYLRNAEFLNQIPEVREELGWGKILPPGAWKPLAPDSEELLDPAPVFGKVPIPLLTIYGTLDKNIDPHQAVDLLGRQQKEYLQNVWIPDADHNMMVGGSGCIQEQLKRYRTVPNISRSIPFENTVIDWLGVLEKP